MVKYRFGSTKYLFLKARSFLKFVKCKQTTFLLSKTMASVDFTPIGKRRPNTKFQVIRGFNADENRPTNRNLFHALKDTTNINHDIGDLSFDTTQEWEDDLKRQTPVKSYKVEPRQETVFENIGLGVNQLEDMIRYLEAQVLDWKFKYKNLLTLMEQLGSVSDAMETNIELRSQLKQMEERLKRSEKNTQKESYILELEHKDKTIRKLIADMETMERELKSHDNDAKLRQECRELNQRVNMYEEKLRESEEKLREYEDMMKLDSSEKQLQSQESSRQISKLKEIIKENEQIYKSEVKEFKSLLQHMESELEAAHKEVKMLKQDAADTSQVKRHFNTDMNELNGANEELRKLLDAERKKLKQLQADVDSLSRTNQNLLDQIEDKKKKLETFNEVHQDNRLLVDKLDEEKERVKELEKELHSVKLSMEREKEAQEELQALLKEAKRPETRSNDAEKLEDMRMENSQLKNRVKELTSHCHELEDNVELFKSKLKSKEQALLEQEAHIQTLEEDNIHLASDQEKLASTNETLRSEAEKMKHDLQLCLQEITNLENLNEIEAEKRVSRLLSNEQALKEEITSLSKLAILLEDELRLLKDKEQDNIELFDDNRELVRKLKEMQRILEDLGVSSKEELEIFESNVRDRIVSMKRDLRDSEMVVTKLEDELRKSHKESAFLQDKVANKEEEIKSLERLIKSDKKEDDSGMQAYLEFQLKKTHEDLNKVTEELRNVKLDHDAQLAKVQTANNNKVKELKDQLSDYKTQLSSSNKDYKQLADKLWAYKTNLRSVEDMERVNYYRDSWDYFKQRYRDATLKAKDFRFMYDFAIDQIKNSRLKLNDDSKLAIVGLYPEYVGGSTKPRITLKGVATFIVATVRLKRRAKYEKNRFEQLNKTRKELDYGRKKFKEIEKSYTVGMKVL